MKKIMKRVAALTLLVLSLAMLASCGKADMNSSGGSFVGAPEYDGGYTGGSSYPDKGESSNGIASTVVQDRKIIKTVNESVQTDTYDEFMTSLYAAISEAGGFVSSKEESGESYYNVEGLRNAYLVVRIPAASLDAFTAGVDSLAVVTSYSESQNDVTGTYIDVQSRIAVLEAEETALLDMLSKAVTVESSLKVRERLLVVQSDLASLRAQLANIDDRAAYSTVYLRVREVRRATENNPSFFAEVGGNFSDNLYGIGRFFRNFAVWLLGDSLLIIITCAAAVGVFFLARYLLRKRKAKLAAAKLSSKKSSEAPADSSAEQSE